MIRAGWVALGSAGAIAVVVGTASLVGPPDAVVTDYPSVQEPIVRSSLVCPYVDGESEGVGEVGVLALPGVETSEPAADDQQPIEVDPLALSPEPGSDEEPAPPDEDAKPLFTLSERGTPLIEEVQTGAATSLAVTGNAALAPGVAAEQSLIVQETDLRGISTAPCTAPRREHWFVGGSGEVGRRGRLVLANPTDVPAVVDVELWDEAGPLDAAGTEDVAVPARSQRLFLLDALAPGSKATGVHVITSRGRVTAALEMRETDDITPQGMSFIPAASPPSDDIVIPGIPGHGKRTLRIVAPGETDAIVSMKILGPEGAFSPLDQDVLTVPAGTVAEVPLDVVGGDPSGVRLTSDEPVTAAVRLVETPSDDGLPDIAFTAASQPLQGPAAALLSPAGDGYASKLYVSSVIETATRVTVRTFKPGGGVANERQLDVPPGATVPVPLKPVGDADGVTAVVEPAAPGSVIAAREISGEDDDGALVDLMPLVSSTIEVDVPVVVGELPSVPEPTSAVE